MRCALSVELFIRLLICLVPLWIRIGQEPMLSDKYQNERLTCDGLESRDEVGISRVWQNCSLEKLTEP